MHSSHVRSILIALSFCGCATPPPEPAVEDPAPTPVVSATAAQTAFDDSWQDGIDRWNSRSLFERVSALAEREPKQALPGPPPPDILPFEVVFEGRVPSTTNVPITLGLVHMPANRANLIEVGTGQDATNDSTATPRYTELVLWNIPASGPRTELGSVRLGSADLARVNHALNRRGGTLTTLHLPLTIVAPSPLPTYVAAEWRCVFRRRATPQNPTPGPWLYGAYAPVVRTD